MSLPRLFDTDVAVTLQVSVVAVECRLVISGAAYADAGIGEDGRGRAGLASGGGCLAGGDQIGDAGVEVGVEGGEVEVSAAESEEGLHGRGRLEALVGVVVEEVEIEITEPLLAAVSVGKEVGEEKLQGLVEKADAVLQADYVETPESDNKTVIRMEIFNK